MKIRQVAPALVVLLLSVLGCKPSPPALPPQPVVQPPARVKTTASVTEAELGMPLYPGSSETQANSKVMETPKDRTVICDLTTQDEPKKVASFYSSRLQHGKQAPISNGMLVSGQLKDGSMVNIQVMPSGPGTSQIGITVYKRR